MLQKDGGTNPTCAEKGEIQLKNNYAVVLGKVMGREAQITPAATCV